MELKSATDLDSELWAAPGAGSTRLNAKVPGLGYSCLRGQEGTMLSDEVVLMFRKCQCF